MFVVVLEDEKLTVQVGTLADGQPPPLPALRTSC